MIVDLLTFLVGVIAGSRAMTAPAAVSWAAYLGLLDLDGTWLAVLGYRFTPWILTLLAFAELVTDQLPSTPSRKAPAAFATRIVMGSLSGAAIGAAGDAFPAGFIAGAAGAIVGTLGGAAIRTRLATAFGKDRPAALMEDAAAIIGAVLIVGAVS